MAAWLLHYIYLPPLDRLWAQAGQLVQFEIRCCLIELVGRFVSSEALVAYSLYALGLFHSK
ncbi:cellulose biosynthesis protein BcsG [Vibrio lentus]|nr:cellulose biosynthesis protein BcsG [Vibrio lentus]